MTLLWPSTVRITEEAAENDDIQTKVLVRTTEKAWSQRDNFNIDPDQEEDAWMAVREEAHSRGTYPLVVELQGTFPSFFAGREPPAERPAVEEGQTELPHADSSVIPGRILIVGDADFMRPQYLLSRAGPQAVRSNFAFIENTLDWLAEDQDLIEVRAKRLEDPNLPEMEDGKREMLKWGNILAWPFLFVLLGVVRWQMRKKAREQLNKTWKQTAGGDK